MKDLEKTGRLETIQTTALSRAAIILSAGDLRRLALTSTPGKGHQLTLIYI